MKKRIGVITLLLALASIPALALQTPPSFGGTWIGEYMTDSGWNNVTVTLHADAEQTSGTISIPGAGVVDAPLSWVIVEGDEIHFELVKDGGTLVFDGKVDPVSGRVRGTCSLPDYEGRFVLVRPSTSAQRASAETQEPAGS